MSLCLLTGFPQLAWAKCDLVLSQTGLVEIQQYNGMNPYAESEPLRLVLSNEGETTCQGQLVFNASMANGRLINDRTDELDYRLTDNNSGNRVLYDSRLQSVGQLQISIPPGELRELNPLIVIPSRQRGHSGEYRAQLEAIFKNRDMAELNVSSDINIALHMTPAVQANFVGISMGDGSEGSQLDLGELYPGLTQRFGLQLRSNTHVDVSIQSENGGTMRHENGSGANINYNLSIAGKTLDLQGLEQVSLPASVNANGITNPANIEIGDFENVPAGNYSDTILIRVSGR